MTRRQGRGWRWGVAQGTALAQHNGIHLQHQPGDRRIGQAHIELCAGLAARLSPYASFQKEAAQAEATSAAEAADRAAQLQVALSELDHRTTNNFRLAAAVLSSHHFLATTLGCASVPDR